MGLAFAPLHNGLSRFAQGMEVDDPFPMEFYMPLVPIEEALAEIKAGRPLIVVDDEDRENEGDLTIAADCVTPELINFMARFGRGLICAPVDASYFERLNIPLMISTEDNGSKYGTNFGVSIGARYGVTTGISAHDRAKTIEVLVNPESNPEDLSRPGHIFPLRACRGGVLERQGHTEAAVDLARLAGHSPAGVIVEILNDDGTMARLPELEAFAEEHNLKICSIADLVAYRRHREDLVKRVESANLPTAHGTFRAIAYEDNKNMEHIALCFGELQEDSELVRLHSACLTGDVFGSHRCDCGDQLDLAMARIQENGHGVVLYLAQEGRGIGLANKIKAYALQDQGLDTVEANHQLGFPDDARTYDVGAAILRDLGINHISLMTNNPKKVEELEACGIKVTNRIEHQVESKAENDNYLRTKALKMGHLL